MVIEHLEFFFRACSHLTAWKLAVSYPKSRRSLYWSVNINVMFIPKSDGEEPDRLNITPRPVSVTLAIDSLRVSCIQIVGVF